MRSRKGQLFGGAILFWIAALLFLVRGFNGAAIGTLALGCVMLYALVVELKG